MTKPNYPSFVGLGIVAILVTGLLCGPLFAIIALIIWILVLVVLTEKGNQPNNIPTEFRRRKFNQKFQKFSQNNQKKPNYRRPSNLRRVGLIG